MEETIKCLIIGSGPAGYTAAIYTSRANLQPVLYEGIEPGGQLTTTTDVENFPGYPDGVSGQQMMADMRRQAERFGTEIRTGTATRVDLASRPFHVVIDGEKEIRAESLIIATGASARYLGLPSETKFRGMGVSACATCDGFFYRKKDVAVVGGVMSVAVMVAQAISKVAMGGFADKNAKVTMITAFVAGVAGILLVWLGVQSEIALYAGACIYGFFFASAVVLCPIVVRQVFGTREYSEIYSRVSVFVNLMGAFGATIWAFLGSNFGYDSVFIVGIVGQVVVLLCGLYAFGKQKSVQAQWTE